MVSSRLPFWSLHTHSKFSVNDALPEVPALVARAVEYDYPALGLTDHGSPSGNIQLYKACRKAGIEPLPGAEFYVVPDTETAGRKDNLHLTVAAYNETGYRNLMKLVTLSAKKFWYKPIVDFADFADMAEHDMTNGLVVATGCYFGVGPQTLMNQGEAAAVRVVEALAGWFPRVYVELQNHGITEHKDGSDSDWTDDDVMNAMYDVAQRAGLPVIVTRDSHYIDEADQPVHDALKSLVSFSEDPDDATFPGGGYFMTDTEGLEEYFPPRIIEAGLDGLTELAEISYLRLPELENFTMKVPDVSLTGDPQEEFERRVMVRAHERGLTSRRHIDRLRHEFDVIRAAGSAPYMLLVDDVCEFMRQKAIRFAARGSASGSLCLYVLGTTQVDPLKYGLRFDRFMSSNRMKPPDVDLDVEHRRRDEVIDFLKSRWAVVPVGSLRKYSLYDEEATDGEESKGALRVRYYSVLRKRAELAGKTGHGWKAPDWTRLPKADRDMLHELADRKLISGYGKHAAGYIVAPNKASLDQLPLAYIASSGSLVTAYGKKDVEILGFVKLDLLGLRTQTAIRLMEEYTGISFDDIPDSDSKTYSAIGSGKVAGVFQLEGYAMARGCESIKPRRLNDIIAAQALFRPATLKSGATGDYRARKAGRLALPKRHEDIMAATKETYGVLLYQEQVMDIMTTLGLDQVELEEMLDAVKASNEYTAGALEAIGNLMPRIRELAVSRGWESTDVDWLSDGLLAYADYSFNKAHAAAYGIIAYRTAWMKVHHPKEFWAAILTAFDDHDKIKGYLLQAKRDGIRIMAPHVNQSGVTYTPVEGMNAIRKGLVALKGVGPVAAMEIVSKAPYTSLDDFCERVLPRKVSGVKGYLIDKDITAAGGVLKALEEGHALEGLD